MVRVDSNFSDALEILYKNRISGIALVSYDFKLSGNLSASDLRVSNTLTKNPQLCTNQPQKGLSPSSFKFFGGSVLQFMAKGTKVIWSWRSQTHLVKWAYNIHSLLDMFPLQYLKQLHWQQPSKHVLQRVSTEYIQLETVQVDSLYRVLVIFLSTVEVSSSQSKSIERFGW